MSKSGHFAGSPLRSSLVDRPEVYFGICLVPAGCNVIVGVVTLGWLDGTFTDSRTMVLHATVSTILSFLVFVALCILLWWSRRDPLALRRPVFNLIQTLLIVLIFGLIGLIIALDLPGSCSAKATAKGSPLGHTSCALLATMSSLSFLPILPMLATILIICYNIVYGKPKLPQESPVWGSWGSENAADRGDISKV
ncbi:hypothetical protein APHAL10511_000509 [Amanita phalloides]|nr:hypothetical protein APHAL10511_000509 [Amanita phalloides]